MQAFTAIPRTVISKMLRRWLAAAASHYGGMGRIDDEYPSRRDLCRIPVGEDCVIDVFWKSITYGKGVSLSLFVCGEEFAKFDCYGPDKGHYHLALFSPSRVGKVRLRFFGTSAEDQITQTVFELENNLEYYMERASNPRIRRYELDRKLLCKSLEEAENKMRQLLSETPQLSDLQ